MVCRGARIPRDDFAAKRRGHWLPKGCRATPDFAHFPPAIGSVSVSHYDQTKTCEVGHHPTTFGELALKRTTSRSRANYYARPIGPDDDFAQNARRQICRTAFAPDENVPALSARLLRERHRRIAHGFAIAAKAAPPVYNGIVQNVGHRSQPPLLHPLVLMRFADGLASRRAPLRVG